VCVSHLFAVLLYTVLLYLYIQDPRFFTIVTYCVPKPKGWFIVSSNFDIHYIVTHSYCHSIWNVFLHMYSYTSLCWLMLGHFMMYSFQHAYQHMLLFAFLEAVAFTWAQNNRELWSLGSSNSVAWSLSMASGCLEFAFVPLKLCILGILACHLHGM